MGKGARLKARRASARIGAVLVEAPVDTASKVHHTATVDESWDGPATVAAMPNDEATLKYCHAWHDPDGDQSEKGSHKFPHHKTKGGPANLAACRNGLARLSSADIPDGERDGVRSHLQAHLDDASDAEDKMNRRPRTRAENTRAARERASGHRPAGVAAEPVGNWYEIRNLTDAPNQVAIYIYQEIGYWGTTALDFVQEFNEAVRGASVVHIHINSGGGEVDDGLAIMNAIRHCRARTIVHIDGLAASAASFIPMGADEVLISPNAQMMIHDAMGLQFGNAAEMRDFADLLDRYSDNIADIYARKSGMPGEECRALMQAETWFTGAEAVAAGLCDGLDGEDMPEPDEDESMAARMTARHDLSLFAFRYAGREQSPAPALTNQVEPAAEPVEPEPVAVEVPEVDATADTIEPAEVSVDSPEDVAVPEVIHEPQISEDQEPGAEQDGVPVGEQDTELAGEPEPVEPAADVPAVEPEAVPVEPTPEPVPIAATTDPDTWAQLMSPLISATPASPTWADVLSTLTKP